MCLFNLLKEVEKLGYEILTYEEVREEFGLNPENIDKVFFGKKIDNKYYFMYNPLHKDLKKRLLNFVNKHCIKKNNVILFSKYKKEA